MSRVDDLRKVVDIISGVALVIVTGVVVWSQFFRDQSTVPAPEVLNDVSIPSSILAHRMGTADIVLLEFADFECPFCGESARDTYPRLKRELIDKGVVSYAFMQFPLQKIHPNALAASVAAVCAGEQDKYWEMHERLFANQDKLASADLAAHAAAIGLDQTAYQQCLSGPAAATVDAEHRQGQALGVRGTPTFFVGRRNAAEQIALLSRVRGAADFDRLKDAIMTVRDRDAAIRTRVPLLSRLIGVVMASPRQSVPQQTYSSLYRGSGL